MSFQRAVGGAALWRICAKGSTLSQGVLRAAEVGSRLRISMRRIGIGTRRRTMIVFGRRLMFEAATEAIARAHAARAEATEVEAN